MWCEELDELLQEYRKYKENRENSMERRDKVVAGGGVKKVKKVVKSAPSNAANKLEIE